MSSTFNSQFSKVFSEDLSVKPCGRFETTELIKLCKEIKNGTDFGDESIGFMNVDNILKLYKELSVAG